MRCLLDVNQIWLDPAPLDPIFERLTGLPRTRREWFDLVIHTALTITSTGRYKDFAEVTTACLEAVATRHGHLAADPEHQGGRHVHVGTACAPGVPRRTTASGGPGVRRGGADELPSPVGPRQVGSPWPRTPPGHHLLCRTSWHTETLRGAPPNGHWRAQCQCGRGHHGRCTRLGPRRRSGGWHVNPLASRAGTRLLPGNSEPTSSATNLDALAEHVIAKLPSR